jgi:putative ABC transport system substrate-binding protein
VNAGTDSDLELAFASFLQQRVGAVLVGSSAFFNRRTKRLAALAARHALPAIYPFRGFRFVLLLEAHDLNKYPGAARC